jgi:hypothetical protein
MDQFLYAFDLPKLNQEYRKHINRSVTSNEIEVGIKNPRKAKELMDSLPNSFRPLQN